MGFHRAITSTACTLLLCGFLQCSRANIPYTVMDRDECDSITCDPVTCKQGGAYIPAGECCEVCPDCTAVRCAEADCAGNFTLPGGCCEVCPSVQCTKTRCQNGGTCFANHDGVVGCWCPHDITGDYCQIVPKPGSCPSTEGTSDQCLEQCSNDYACDGNKRCCSNGCGHACMEPVYDINSCKHMGPWYDGTFYDACNECLCLNGEKACTLRYCETKGCEYGGKWYSDGEKFKDECNDCVCSNGTVACTLKECYKTCNVNGVWYYVGDIYRDKCNMCTCEGSGSGKCTEKACDVEGCQDGNKWYDSRTVFDSEGGCVTCYCQRGSIGCGESTCLGSCRHGTRSIMFLEGNLYKDDCTTCVCGKDNKERCTTNLCPPPDCTSVQCDDPECTDGVIPPRACCPVCDQGCNITGTVVASGAVFSCGDGCADCTCVKGSVEITPRECQTAAAGLGVSRLTLPGILLFIVFAIYR